LAEIVNNCISVDSYFRFSLIAMLKLLAMTLRANGFYADLV